MAPRTWEQIVEAFLRLRDVPVADRPGLLAELEQGIRAEVESLLEAEEKAGSFLQHPETPLLGPGTQLGPYRILQQIGRGGMGVVYLAERSDGEFRRQVAVKITGGRLFGPEAERRFIHERQILAQLDHPNIVRLFDGGIADGRRYFVMEFIRGQSLTSYARDLALYQRLRLFVDVCAAVQYAHVHMILHRDLKPANVLVTDQGVVKLLDFGVAQLVGNEYGGAEDTALRPLTLLCASPEQVRGEPLTMASDIYSLGVLLYELVSGRHPHEPEGASHAELVHAILETDPMPPSIHRPGIGADLSAVCLKALAKQPAKRYASAGELQSDVERVLAGRPVLAVPPSPLYLAQRFVSRNKALSVAVACLLVSLIGSAAFFYRQSQIEAQRFASSYQLVRMLINEVQPELEGMSHAMPLRQTLVRGTIAYLEALLRSSPDDPLLLLELSNSHLQLSRLQGNAFLPNLGKRADALREMQTAERLLLRALTLDPRNPEMTKAAAVLYGELAAMEVQNARRNDALQHSATGMSYAERFLAKEGQTWAGRRILAIALYHRGAALAPQPEALPLLIQANQMLDRMAEERPAEHFPLIQRMLSDWRITEIAIARDDVALWLTHARSALGTAERLLAREPELQRYRVYYSSANVVLARALLTKGDPQAALPLAERAVSMRERIFAQDPLSVQAKERFADANLALANTLVMLKRFGAAEPVAQKAVNLYGELDASGRLAPNFRPFFAAALLNLALASEGLGKSQAACSAAQQAAQRFEAAFRGAPVNRASQFRLRRAKALTAAQCGK